MMSEPSPFWLVWREGGRSPLRKHESEFHAEQEASRLAQEAPGNTFFVVAPVAAVTAHKLEIERFDPTDDVPF